jgi:hypothetical protein
LPQFLQRSAQLIRGVRAAEKIGALIRLAGYRGDVEVEIFNESVRATDGHAVIETMKQRYRDLVLPALTGTE